MVSLHAEGCLTSLVTREISIKQAKFTLHPRERLKSKPPGDAGDLQVCSGSAHCHTRRRKRERWIMSERLMPRDKATHSSAHTDCFSSRCLTRAGRVRKTVLEVIATGQREWTQLPVNAAGGWQPTSSEGSVDEQGPRRGTSSYLLLNWPNRILAKTGLSRLNTGLQGWARSKPRGMGLRGLAGWGLLYHTLQRPMCTRRERYALECS